MKYENPITNHSRNMANVKVSADKQMTDGRAKTYLSPQPFDTGV
jgi:hypothetical protein